MNKSNLYHNHVVSIFNNPNQIMKIFICIVLFPGTLILANQLDVTSRVEVGIINFLYLHDNGYNSQNNSNHNIETSILFPALEREIKKYGMSNYSIKFEKVMAGNMLYSESGDIKSEIYESTGDSYDLSVWGLVNPINWPSHYDLDLIIYVDSHLLFRSVLKVRNNKIALWDGKKCNLSQDALSILPGIFAYALTHQNGKKLNDEIMTQILERIKLLPKSVAEKTLTIIRDWYTKKNGLSHENVGSVEFVYESGINYKVSIDKSMSNLLKRFLTTNKSFNWYLDQGGVLMPEISISFDSPATEISTSDFEMSYSESRTATQIQIGIVPFENNSKSSNHDWLGFGLEYLLSNKFSHILHYQLADRNAVLRFINLVFADVRVNTTFLLRHGIVTFITSFN